MRTVPHSWFALIVALAATISGCPPPSDGPAPLACAGADAGVAACVSLRVQEPAAELIHGPQGGFHIDVATAFAGTDPVGLTIEYTATRVSDGAELGRVEYRITPRLLGTEGGAYVHADDIIVLDILAPADVVGAVLTLRTRLVRDEIEIAADEVTVTVVDEIEELISR